MPLNSTGSRASSHEPPVNSPSTTPIELLDSALTRQDARRAWIIQHWPHIVEYQEIDRVLLLGNEPPGLEIAPAQVEPEGVGIDLDF